MNSQAENTRNPYDAHKLYVKDSITLYIIVNLNNWVLIHCQINHLHIWLYLFAQYNAMRFEWRDTILSVHFVISHIFRRVLRIWRWVLKEPISQYYIHIEFTHRNHQKSIKWAQVKSLLVPHKLWSGCNRMRFLGSNTILQISHVEFSINQERCNKSICSPWISALARLSTIMLRIIVKHLIDCI